MIRFVSFDDSGVVAPGEIEGEKCGAGLVGLPRLILFSISMIEDLGVISGTLVVLAEWGMGGYAANAKSTAKTRRTQRGAWAGARFSIPIGLGLQNSR